MSDFEKQPLITSTDEQPSYSNQRKSEELSEDATLPGGLTVFKCAVFIFSSITGSGVLALPYALSNAGWSGLILLLFVCVLSGYCGVICGKCWMIVRKKKPNIDYTRDPFPAIGHAAAGNIGYIFTEISVLLSLMGVSIVFLILGSQQFVSIIEKSFDGVSQIDELRAAIFICGLVLIPFQWLGTSKDIASFIVGASVCTAIASFIIVYESIAILSKNGFPETRRDVTGESFFMAFGTIAFTFGGGTLFPSFQADMQKPSKFPLALVLGFIGVLFIYLPAALLPFLVIGEPNVDIMISLKSNMAVDHKYVLTIAQCLISIHILSTIVLVNNPISLQIEEHLKIPHGKNLHIDISYSHKH